MPPSLMRNEAGLTAVNRFWLLLQPPLRFDVHILLVSLSLSDWGLLQNLRTRSARKRSRVVAPVMFIVLAPRRFPPPPPPRPRGRWPVFNLSRWATALVAL